MAEDICFLKKDTHTLVIRAPKKSPLTLRIIVLFYAMVCGIYICLFCFNQINISDNNIIIGDDKNTKLEADNIQQSCPSSGDDLEQSQLNFVHYPIPQTFSREECKCNGVRYFVIVSMQRSGSGWFETLLNSHMNVSSNGEIFAVQERRLNLSSIFNTMDQLYNLDWFTSASKNQCSAAVGFKWMLNQGITRDYEEIVEYLKKKGVSVILLFRRNLLRRIISVLANSFDKFSKPLNGIHKSHVHSHFEAQILAKHKPTINTTSMVDELKEANETITRALEYFGTTRHIVLYYEDVVNNRTKLKDVQEFLRLPYRQLESRQVKIHTEALSEQVENWDEVYKALNGTSFENFIHSN